MYIYIYAYIVVCINVCTCLFNYLFIHSSIGLPVREEPAAAHQPVEGDEVGGGLLR